MNAQQIHEIFKEADREFFGGRLGELAPAIHYGEYRHIGLCDGTKAIWVDAGRSFENTIKTLLHEMIHMELNRQGRKNHVKGGHYHTKAFANEAYKLGVAETPREKDKCNIGGWAGLVWSSEVAKFINQLRS